MANARHEASDRLNGDYEVRVLEPSPPTVNEGPWFADDPSARGDVESGRTVVGPTSAADLEWNDLCGSDPALREWCAARWLGGWSRLAAPPDGYDETRQQLHVLAEHVLAAARHRANGKIGLRFTRGGFGTPFFGDDEQVRIDGDELVYQQGNRETRQKLTTAEDAARVAGIRCGAPRDVYRPTTTLDPDAELRIDRTSARYLGDLYGLGTSVLEELRARATAEESPSRVQLWPEHFDVALELGDESAGERAGYGLSPGDENYDAPYLYVVPWDECPSDTWWNGTYFAGASCDLSELLKAPDQRERALDFFEEGRRRLRATRRASASS